MSTSTSIALFLAIFVAAATAVPYSKYGRSCKDIGCRSDEVCVMAEDPCSSYQRDSCGRYPTCQRSTNGGESCTTKICPSGQYCKSENGRPTCVNTTPGLEYDSAGISSVNGHRTNNNNNQPSVPADPSNPYANANAPPAEDVNHDRNQPSYANNGQRNGYSPNQPNVYPNNGYMPGSTNNNNGYPPYPINNNGYPPYPTNNQNTNMNNRPAVDQYGYPIYPSPQTPRPENRFHNYPQHNLPQHNPGWSNTYPNSMHRRNGASSSRISVLTLFSSVLLSYLTFRIAKA